MITTAQRLQLLSEHSHLFEEWTGAFNNHTLENWISEELCVTETEDIAPETILHILSGNTPHAAHQTLLRGLILGSQNLLKLPSQELSELAHTLEHLPPQLTGLIEQHPALTQELIDRSQVVTAYGSDESLAEIKKLIPREKRYLPHGTRLSMALIDLSEGLPDPETLHHLAHAIGYRNQQGCLSLQSLYAIESEPLKTQDLTVALAPHLDAYQEKHPRNCISLSESGKISNLKATYRYIAATSPNDYQLHESSTQNTHWTLITKTDPTLTPSPLNRFAYLSPFPTENTSEKLGLELQHLSTIIIHPQNDKIRALAQQLNPHRICPPADLHTPPINWHHDGLPPLASLCP